MHSEASCAFGGAGCKHGRKARDGAPGTIVTRLLQVPALVLTFESQRRFGRGE